MDEEMERRKFEMDLEQTRAATAKLINEAMKIMEETKKIAAERRWYPLASAGVGAIIAAVIVAFSKLSG
jgi:hypothetical protein